MTCVLDISDMETINHMRDLVRSVGNAEQKGDWLEAESVEFWHQVKHILGEDAETFGQAIGVGTYCYGAKGSEHDCMEAVMTLLQFKHHMTKDQVMNILYFPDLVLNEGIFTRLTACAADVGAVLTAIESNVNGNAELRVIIADSELTKWAAGAAEILDISYAEAEEYFVTKAERRTTMSKYTQVSEKTFYDKYKSGLDVMIGIYDIQEDEVKSCEGNVDHGSLQDVLMHDIMLTVVEGMKIVGFDRERYTLVYYVDNIIVDAFYYCYDRKDDGHHSSEFENILKTS